jgi:hypothetical protein
MTCRRLLFVVPGAVAGHGHGGEPARPRPEPAHAPPVLRGGAGARRRSQRPARPLAALHGADPHQRAAHPPARSRDKPAAAGRRRRGRRLVVVHVPAWRSPFLVEAAPERARVVRGRAHAAPPAPNAARGGGRRRDAEGRARRPGVPAGELDAGGRSGTVVRGWQDRAARPSRARHRRHESCFESFELGGCGDWRDRRVLWLGKTDVGVRFSLFL